MVRALWTTVKAKLPENENQQCMSKLKGIGEAQGKVRPKVHFCLPPSPQAGNEGMLNFLLILIEAVDITGTVLSLRGQQRKTSAQLDDNVDPKKEMPGCI